jgi:hypothetical protein
MVGADEAEPVNQSKKLAWACRSALWGKSIIGIANENKHMLPFRWLRALPKLKSGG